MRVLVATCSADEAEDLVRRMLEERLIACANIVPGVQSHYWWKGEITSDEEALLVMETSEGMAGAAAARLRELHSYAVPKILTLEPVACDADYLAWLRSELGTHSTQ